jgi:uncharacterized protein (UPF0335 family)
LTDVEPVWAFSEILRHVQNLGESLKEITGRLDRIEEAQRNHSNAIVAVQAEQRSTANSTDLKRIEASISLLAAEIHGIGVDISAMRLLRENGRPKP